MEGITICYDFKFSLDVKKRNGKTYRNQTITGLGLRYTRAIWDVYFKLKRRNTFILKVNSVSALRIAFAFQGEDYLSLNLQDFPPVIPTDLSLILQDLPDYRK
jgi:hypothetical protein